MTWRSSATDYLRTNLVDVFARRVVAAPHRDITHVSYAEWLRLYLNATKGWRQYLHDHPPPTREEARHAHGDAADVVDALLWRSIFAAHWSQVEANTPTHAHALHPFMYWPTQEMAMQQQQQQQQQRVLYEMLSPDYLTEPLLGGQDVLRWPRILRANAAAETSTASKDECGGANASSSSSTTTSSSSSSSPTLVRLMLPFTTLWTIRETTFVRPQQQTTKKTSPTTTTCAAKTLSLQERHARQSLLRGISQAVELQSDVLHLRHPQRTSTETHGDAHNNNNTNASSLELLLWSPLREFDAIAELPILRREAQMAQTNAPTTTTSASASASASSASSSSFISPIFDLPTVCGVEQIRLAYLAHHAARTITTMHPPPHHADDHHHQPRLALLAHTPDAQRVYRHTLASLRQAALFTTKESSDVRLTPSSDANNMDGEVLRRGSSHIHMEAMRSCGQAARRMTNREENLRQSFTARRVG